MSICLNSLLKKTGEWILFVLRISVGAVVLRVGFQLASGEQYFGYYQDEGWMAGLFVMAIGGYFIFSNIFNQFFEKQN